jgi:transposase
MITPKWPKRIKSYNNSTWFLVEIRPNELGVWHRAGQLPLSWTNGSLAETAKKVAKGFEMKSKLIKRRPKYAIPNILKIKTHTEQKEKYLYPIVFKTDTGTQGRKRLKTKTKGDIDDGCMRSIALAINGSKTIKVYYGVPKK